MVWSFPRLLPSLAASDDRSALRRCVDHLPMRLVAQPAIDDAADDAADQRRTRRVLVPLSAMHIQDE